MELIHGWKMQEVEAKKVAKQSAIFDQNNPHKAIEGVGRPVAKIPIQAWHYWGQRLGYECWEDDQFLREFLRDNPETAVNNYTKRTMTNGAVFTADGFLT